MRTHFIPNGETEIAFFPDSLRFFTVNEFTRKLIEQIQAAVAKEQILAEFALTSEQYDQFVAQLQDVLRPVENFDQDYHERKILDRLVLNISNDCNLRCGYCYANGGTYMSEAMLMPVEVAVRTMQIALDYFEEIGVIQLFGGEPLMNLPAVEAVCQYLEEHFPTSKLQKKPPVGVVTNGTIVNERVLELIKRYDLGVTVSLDGPKVVNDMLRVFADGRGSYDLIPRNIKLMRETTGRPDTIEVTYHRGHQDAGVSVFDIVRFIDEEFPGVEPHIVPVDCAKGEAIYLDDFSSFVESVDLNFDLGSTEHPLTFLTLKGYVRNLNTKKSSKMLCSAAINTIAVNARGEVYPCFQFVDRGDLLMGNVFDENLFGQPAFQKMRSHFGQFDKLTNEPCKSCFINRICKSCFWRNEFYTGDMFTFTEEHCEMNRRMVERAVVGLAGQ